jgi:two-component system, chemotaxis family, protein-glutamate methylesterase/glutaminase
MEENGISKTVVIGGSAGSLDVLLRMVPHFPSSVNAIYVIVIHRKSGADSILTGLLSSRTTMPVKEVEDKEVISPNHIYIAPPDYHLLCDDSYTFSLDSSEKIHYSRPSIDVTFESVAYTFGSSVIGLLLSGANADGADGLHTIKKMGGYTIVQDPSSCEVSYMPLQAINKFNVDAILNAESIGMALMNLMTSSK